MSMRSTDLLLASCDELPQLDEDSAPLLQALRERGVVCRVAAWDDPRVDWSDARAVLARSTWDYTLRRDEFVAWADRVQATDVPFWPGADIIAWNTEKSYLRALEAAGVPTVPTVWVDPGADATAAAGRVRARGWDDAIVKPQIAVGAEGLCRFTGACTSQTETIALIDHVTTLSRDGGAMIQPYLPGVAESGELSVFFCEGRVTHAVRKHAADGDFRVQPEHGGSFELETPSGPELDAATWAVAAVAARSGAAPLLARADLVDGPNGGPVLIELELIEPRLFLRIAPHASAAMADAIVARLAALG